MFKQGKDSPEDKNKTPRRQTQGLIFLWRRLSVSALHRIYSVRGKVVYPPGPWAGRPYSMVI